MGGGVLANYAQATILSLDNVLKPLNITDTIEFDIPYFNNTLNYFIYYDLLCCYSRNCSLLYKKEVFIIKGFNYKKILNTFI